MSEKVSFSKLVEELSKKTETTQSLSHDFITNLTDLVIDSTKQTGKASLTNFGSFSIVNVAARNGVNPQTGEAIVIPAHQRLSFAPYKALENSVNAPYANLEATLVEDDASAPITKKAENESSDSNTVVPILAALIVIAVVFGVWFFVFRNSNSTEIAQENSAPQVEKTDQTTQPLLSSTPVNQELNSLDNTDQETITENTSTENAVVDEIAAETRLVENAPIGTSSHIVTTNEWFYEIARKNYSRTTFWPLIFESNFTVAQDPDILKPGKELSIPSIQNSQNPTLNDRKRLAVAAKLVSDAYANAGKTEKANAYAKMAERFSN
tara:strand:- start:29709 stop:30680 length:972 start_codon:yes stop_codon:yes gene_type:complete